MGSPCRTRRPTRLGLIAYVLLDHQHTQALDRDLQVHAAMLRVRYRSPPDVSPAS